MHPGDFSPSSALFAAALAGLTGLATAGCSSSDDSAKSTSGVTACPNPPAQGVITSSEVVTDMTLEKFSADCKAANGALEIHPHCGGANTCRGMSYDEGTQTLTHHTCKGLNTCGGYSCIICG